MGGDPVRPIYSTGWGQKIWILPSSTGSSLSPEPSRCLLFRHVLRTNPPHVIIQHISQSTPHTCHVFTPIPLSQPPFSSCFIKFNLNAKKSLLPSATLRPRQQTNKKFSFPLFLSSSLYKATFSVISSLQIFSAFSALLSSVYLRFYPSGYVRPRLSSTS